nr:hypothetical protein [Treponema sp.]
MKKFPLVWVIFHSIILLAFLISLAVSPKIRFATSLFEILPPSSSLHEVQQADTNLGSKTGRAVTILVRGPSFQKAKSAAEKLYLNYVTDSGAGFIPDSRYFDRLSLYVDSESVAQMRDWLHKNRFVLLSKEDQEALNSGNAGQLAERAVMSAYGAFTLSDLSSLEEDPFLLSEESLKNLLGGGALSSTNMTLKDQ